MPGFCIVPGSLLFSSQGFLSWCCAKNIHPSLPPSFPPTPTPSIWKPEAYLHRAPQLLSDDKQRLHDPPGFYPGHSCPSHPHPFWALQSQTPYWQGSLLTAFVTQHVAPYWAYISHSQVPTASREEKKTGIKATELD